MSTPVDTLISDARTFAMLTRPDAPRSAAFRDAALRATKAETLVTAATRGQLSLTLRSVADFVDSSPYKRPASSQTVRLIRFGRGE